jgi:hypothetical protein
MDAKLARPWLRPESVFRHKDLRKWVSEQRGAILAAILTIAQAWALTGKPEAQGLPNLGGYETYCRVVGGVLAFMGIEGFLGNLTELYEEMDTETPQWATFLEAWQESFGDKAITAKEMANYISENKDLRTVLPDAIDDPEARNYSVKLGQRLARRNGVRYPNGLSLVKAGEKKHAVTWKVVRFENETSPGFSLKGEVGEVISTSARIERHEDKNNTYISKCCTTSPNLTSASKMGEVAGDNASPRSGYSPPDGDATELRETYPEAEWMIVRITRHILALPVEVMTTG